MAVKPDPVNDLPPPWGGAGNYPPSVFPAFLPWGEANPNAGDPTPWSNQPRLNATGLAAFANTGFEPAIPTDASPWNEWLRLVQLWPAWTAAGSSAAAADAHIMETDANGWSASVKHCATAGFFGDLFGEALLPAGAKISEAMQLELEADASVEGVDNTTSVSVGALDLLQGGVPTATGFGYSAGGELFFGLSNRVHNSPSGWVYATGDAEADTGFAAVQLVAETTVAVVGYSAGNVRIRVEGQAQVTALPQTLLVSLEEDQTNNPAWTVVGSVANNAATATAADPLIWQDFRLERVFAAGTTDLTKYRTRVEAGGGNVRVREVRLTVVGERG